MSVQEWPLKHIQTDSAKIEEKEKKKKGNESRKIKNTTGFNTKKNQSG